ncbi:hypothetical protein C7974DRAFT_410853 [Boeremia exigua]|uniref:uncharacterized protein n=1 Tax=Boeremia exigua TaxID=749465 RepID=UPI001E8E89D3|nr:uncharacterized protein C7974DRAFT_410853 [Boeremia exigua]KAH6637372.1 hypothetical protein C7974DRAFT_410853 [Boeremia exigua]
MALLLLYGFVSPSSAQNAQTKITLHPIYRTVPPPGDSFPQDAGHILVVSFVLLAISLAFVAVSFTESKRWNSTVPAALTVGASTCVLAEAINCYLSNVYWTTSHDSKQLMFTLLGREFDLYVGIIWWSFGSALSCCIYAALMRNVSTGTLWACLAVAGLADLVLEEVMLNYGGIYTYYGHQPLVIFGLFPCWWLFANVAGIFMGISVTYRYRNWFNGWKSIFLIPILPFCYVGPQVLAALPTIYVVQADHSPLVTQVCGILTASISVIEAGVIMDTILGRDPLHFGRAAPKGKSA